MPQTTGPQRKQQRAMQAVELVGSFIHKFITKGANYLPSRFRRRQTPLGLSPETVSPIKSESVGISACSTNLSTFCWPLLAAKHWRSRRPITLSARCLFLPNYRQGSANASGSAWLFRIGTRTPDRDGPKRLVSFLPLFPTKLDPVCLEKFNGNLL